MSLPVRFVFELVGEVAASWTVGVGGVFCGEGAGAVDEVHGVDYWGWGTRSTVAPRLRRMEDFSKLWSEGMQLFTSVWRR